MIKINQSQIPFSKKTYSWSCPSCNSYNFVIEFNSNTLNESTGFCRDCVSCFLIIKDIKNEDCIIEEPINSRFEILDIR